MTALHIAAQAGRTDLVRYLLGKGANTEIVNSEGRKAIDLVGAAAGNPAAAPAPPAAATTPATTERPGAGAPRNVPGGGAANAASAAEIRTLLQNAGAKGLSR